jgi:14-3-3 protein epsilon
MAQPNLEGLSLHDEGEEGFCFDFEEEEEDDIVDLRWCLIGRFLCERTIHFNSMKVRMADLWKPVKGVTIKEAAAGKFLFHFNHPMDMEAVLNGGPWTFDNNMLLLERVRLGMQIEHIPLNHVNMWVQIHDIPMGLMKEKYGIQFANYIGKFVEYDKNNNSSFWRQYMRIRVQIDVRSPLKKNTKVKNREGEWCIVKFKYEKLGIFCFVCGIMGHAENKCAVLFSKELDDGIREWSAEIRADPRRQRSRVTSRWLRDEKGGRAEQGGGNTAVHSSFPVDNSTMAAELAATTITSSHNRPNCNHSAIITRKEQSLVINDLLSQPCDHKSSSTTPRQSQLMCNQETRNQTLTSSQNHNNQSFQINPIISQYISKPTSQTISITVPPIQPGADSIIIPSSNIDLSVFNAHINPIRPETETSKPNLLPNQTFLFNSQLTKSDPPQLTTPNPKITRGPDQTLRPTHNPNKHKPDQTHVRPSQKKTQRVTNPKPNPTLKFENRNQDQEAMELMEGQGEKKRRRAEEYTNDNNASESTEHFLTAGPGSQACRDK